MLHNLRFFSLQNAIYFIMLPCLVPVLFAFYLQDVLKFKCKIPAPKGFKVRQSDHTWTGISTDRYRSCLRPSARQSSSVPGDKGRDVASNYSKTSNSVFIILATIRRCTVQFWAWDSVVVKALRY